MDCFPAHVNSEDYSACSFADLSSLRGFLMGRERTARRLEGPLQISGAVSRSRPFSATLPGTLASSASPRLLILPPYLSETLTLPDALLVLWPGHCPQGVSWDTWRAHFMCSLSHKSVLCCCCPLSENSFYVFFCLFLVFGVLSPLWLRSSSGSCYHWF